MATIKPRILCVGVAGIDYVASVDHFPKPDEKIRSNSLVIDGGGNAANTACTIGRLNAYARVAIVTTAGNDANGDTIVDGLRKYGVDVTYVERFEGISPFTYVIVTTNDLEHSRTCIHQRGNGCLTVDFVEKNIPIEEFSAVHFDTRYPSAALHLARKCTERNIPYSLDVEKPREGLRELMSNATVVFCNSQYCDAVLGQMENNQKSDAELVNRLRRVVSDQAPRAEIALVTLGCRGSCIIRTSGKDFDCEDENVATVILQGESSEKVPSVTKGHSALWCPAWGECKVVDTTGAGDAFQGGFLTAIWTYVASKKKQGDVALTMMPELPKLVSIHLNDQVLAQSLRIATWVATKKMEVSGARRGLPYIVEDTFLQSEFNALLEL